MSTAFATRFLRPRYRLLNVVCLLVFIVVSVGIAGTWMDASSSRHWVVLGLVVVIAVLLGVIGVHKSWLRPAYFLPVAMFFSGLLCAIASLGMGFSARAVGTVIVVVLIFPFLRDPRWDRRFHYSLATGGTMSRQ